MRNFMNRIEELWCTQMHSAVMWPIHGKYRCGRCFREYQVGFETDDRHEGVRPAVTASLAAAR